MTTTTISQSGSANFTGVVDGNLQEGSPTTSFTTLRPGNTTGDRRHGFMKFTGLSNITGPVTVSAVTLTILTDSNAAAGTIGIHKIKSTIVPAQATWNEMSSGVSWSSIGGYNATDIDTTPLQTITTTASNYTQYVFATSAAFVALVEGWINGTVANNGILFTGIPESTGSGFACGISDSISANVDSPLLTVDWTVAASGPTVSTVSSASNTEGSAVVHTVTLSGATSGSTNFAATLVGVTATGAGTDFTSDLASATYSNGVTFSGGNMVVPDAVSGWTVTIATTGDTLDEANETATLTVGGTAGTLTITDDDAAPTITGTASSTVTAGDPVVITYSPGLSGQTRTYTLALTDGTAVGGTDYDNTTVTGDFAVTAGTGSVSFSGSTVTVDPGVTEFTLSIGTTA